MMGSGLTAGNSCTVQSYREIGFIRSNQLRIEFVPQGSLNMLTRAQAHSAGAVLRRSKDKAGTRSSLRSMVLLTVVGFSTGAAGADPSKGWRGLLYTCGQHPTVHIPADVAYAYEKDLTHTMEGKVSFGRSSATVSFPRMYGTFTIVKRGGNYLVNDRKCTVDRV